MRRTFFENTLTRKQPVRNKKQPVDYAKWSHKGKKLTEHTIEELNEMALELEKLKPFAKASYNEMKMEAIGAVIETHDRDAVAASTKLVPFQS
jgi:hypothetical protein